MAKVNGEEAKVVSAEEKAKQFLAEYEELAQKFGFMLEAIPFETAESTIRQKLRVVRYAKPA